MPILAMSLPLGAFNAETMLPHVSTLAVQLPLTQTASKLNVSLEFADHLVRAAVVLSTKERLFPALILKGLGFRVRGLRFTV